MRILHILNHVWEIGNGITNMCVDLACTQSAEGDVVSVVSGGGEYVSLLEDHGVCHFELLQVRKPRSLLRSFKDYQAILEQFNPDIVHAHMMTGLVLSFLLKPFNKYKLVTTVHNKFQRSSLLMGLGQRVITVSDSVAHSMTRRGIPQRRIRTVLNGTVYSPRLTRRRASDYRALPNPSIVTVAGIYERKGIGDVLEAFLQVAARHSGVHLFLVGDGPDRNRYEMLAKSTPFADRIHFEGFQANPLPYITNCSLFVLASHHDSCPLVISEARAEGCAIIGTSVDGIPEALDNGEAGIIVPPHNPQRLAQVILELLQDEEQLNELRTRATQDIERFTVYRVCHETKEVYLELLN